MTATYAVPIELVRFLGIESSIPDKTIVSSERVKETIGAGTTLPYNYFLDHGFVIIGTLNLYYGASETGVTATLTEGTHFILDKDNGQINLTASGTAIVGTANNLYASYSYAKAEITNTQMQNALDRAQSEIDAETLNHFYDGATATPDYGQATDEKHDGKGKYDRAYYLKHFPIPDVSCKLSSDVSADSGTVEVDSTSGFPLSGVIGIEDDKITYTSKTATQFIGCTSVSGHSASTLVKPYAIEMSTDDSGAEPVWQVMDEDSQFDIDLNTGRVHLFRDNTAILSLTSLSDPPRLIPNRFRASYIYGTSAIPQDINRLTLMIATKELMHSAVRKATVLGQDSFRPELIGVDNDWIIRTKAYYTNKQVSNV